MRTRLLPLDSLRGVAVMLVVLHHALLPYVDLPYGRLWVARADSWDQSRLLSGLLWWLIAFIMPLYFVLAGFFAAKLVAELGPGGFLRHRARRLLVPYLIGAVTVLPVAFYVFAAGWWLNGDCTWNDIRRVRFSPDIQAELFGQAHLWFLQYLFVYCALFALGRKLPRSERWHLWLAARWRPFYWALPTFAVIWIHPAVVTTFHNSFVPDPFKFLLYAIYFASGAWFYRCSPTLTQLGNRAHLLLSILLFAALEPLLRSSLSGEPTPGAGLLLAIGLALTAWLSIFGLLGWASAAGGTRRTKLTYVGAASYWTYLVHLPLVAALQILLMRVPVPAVLKCAVVTVVAFSACLWSYERWVRYTFIGVALNGPRERPAPSRWPASSIASSNAAWIASVE